MAVIVNGRQFRTLSNPIYLGDGRQVKEVYANGSKVYPEDAPKGRYVLRLSGHYARTYLSGEPTVFRPGGVLSSDNSDWLTFTRTFTGHVSITAISDLPIAVLQQPYNIPSPSGQNNGGGYCRSHDDYVAPSGLEMTGADVGLYHYSDMLHYVCPNGTCVLGKNPIPASVGFSFVDQSGSDFYSTGASTTHGGSMYECSSRHHIAIAISGSCTRPPRGYTVGAFSHLWPIDSLSEFVWRAAQGVVIKKGFHDTPYDDGVRMNNFGHDIVANPVRGRSYTKGRLNIYSFCYGYSLSPNVPWESGGFGVTPQVYDRTLTMAICPFTTILYNNNPPITSPTFITDPPTEEAPESERIFTGEW